MRHIAIEFKEPSSLGNMGAPKNPILVKSSNECDQKFIFFFLEMSGTMYFLIYNWQRDVVGYLHTV